MPYTVIRAMCQVNGGWSFLAMWGSETPEPIHLKSDICDYVRSPTAQAKYGGPENGGLGGHMGEVVPSRAFLFLFLFFGSFNASTAYPEKRGFSPSASKNVFRWWVCPLGVDLHRGSNLPFCPKTIFFFNRPNKAIILHGSD